MANVDFDVVQSDGAGALHIQVQTLTGTTNVVMPKNSGTVSVLEDATQVWTAPIKINAVGSVIPPATLTNVGLDVYGDSVNFIQINLRNTNANGTADYTLTTDNGNDSTGYSTFGINNSNYVGTYMVGAYASYLSNVGGDIGIVAETPGKTVVIGTGGTTIAYARAIFRDTYQAIYNAGLEARLGGVLWNKTSTTTLTAGSGWSTATSILGADNTGVGTKTLSAAWFTVGRKLSLKLRGVITSRNTTDTFTITVTVQGITVCATAAFTTGATLTNAPWEMEIEIECRATGAVATVIGNGKMEWSSVITPYRAGTAQTTAVNVNTANTALVEVLAACSYYTATNSISCIHATLAELG